MKNVDLGSLTFNDIFYYKGQKHRALYIAENKSVNSVCCLNLETKKRIWLDITSPVDIKEVKKICQHQ